MSLITTVLLWLTREMKANLKRNSVTLRSISLNIACENCFHGYDVASMCKVKELCILITAKSCNW